MVEVFKGWFVETWLWKAITIVSELGIGLLNAALNALPTLLFLFVVVHFLNWLNHHHKKYTRLLKQDEERKRDHLERRGQIPIESRNTYVSFYSPEGQQDLAEWQRLRDLSASMAPKQWKDVDKEDQDSVDDE
tara:strand:- start:1615 stop:2013 length:399 start_codon:yes stop_codon:yes gene_type:complete